MGTGDGLLALIGGEFNVVTTGDACSAVLVVALYELNRRAIYGMSSFTFCILSCSDGFLTLIGGGSNAVTTGDACSAVSYCSS